MGNVIEIPPIQETVPMEEKHLCVAAYCRVSTDQEEQDSSIRDICYAFIRHSLCVKRICKLDGLSRV